MCFISPLQAELGRGYPRGAEARAVAVLSRGCRTRPTRHQAEPEMLARPERPRPGPRPPPVSPFPPPPSLLLLLLAMLSAPVCGRVPRSVPRTSLPISGKIQGPLSSALCTVSCPCQQVPTPTCPAKPSSSIYLGPLCTVHTPLGPRLRPLPCAFPSHLMPPHPTPSHLSHPQPGLAPQLPRHSQGAPEAHLFQQGAALHPADLDTEAQGGPGVCPRLPISVLYLSVARTYTHTHHFISKPVLFPIFSLFHSDGSSRPTLIPSPEFPSFQLHFPRHPFKCPPSAVQTCILPAHFPCSQRLSFPSSTTNSL